MANELFGRREYKIQTLVDMANDGTLGLPDLQRGFVWKASKVRDLLDSMLKGYPIGYIMLWASQNTKGDNKTIGADEKRTDFQDYVIIDGQQRITSLYAVITGKDIIDESGRKPIKISFNPIKREFAVRTAAMDKDPEWIADISNIFNNETRSRKYVNEFIEQYEESLKKNELELDDDLEQRIADNIANVLDLKNYIINALVINNDVDEEDVAYIFTRINSGGVKLNENDFILTLMSVVSPELRDKIEQFCEESKIPTDKSTSYNRLIEVKPQHIIRTTMAYTFKRARLKYAYMLLRGNSLKRGADNNIDLERRKENFEKLADGLEKVLNLDNWHGFIKAVTSAGFLNSSLISSDNTLVYCYMIYLIGKYDFNVEYDRLRKIVAKWFFMTSTTSHYTGSFEAVAQEELNAFMNLNTADEFESYIDNQISVTFTNDYFEYTLPNSLITSSVTSSVWYTYLASLNILDAKVLFSDMYIRDLLSGDFNGNRSALERHHLFPKAYLSKIGYNDDKDRNQIANFAYIEWEDNMEIEDNAPDVYFKPIFEKKIEEENRKKIMNIHALPDNWYTMEYKDFLDARRKLMAKVIKQGYEQLIK